MIGRTTWQARQHLAPLGAVNEVQPHQYQVFCVSPALFRDRGVQIELVALAALLACAAHELNSVSCPLLGPVFLHELDESGVLFWLP